MNILDRAIAVFSPERALKRAVARKQLDILNSGYGHHGASRTKKSLVGWISKGGSPKEDIDKNLPILRERSRDLYMGAPLATGALKTMRTNVVGAGLQLKAQIDADFLGMSDEEAEAWEELVEREFSLWASSVSCDAQRMNNFYELQQLAFLSQLMSGDCFALLPVIPRPGMPYDLRIQLIEADRVCDPQPKPPDKDISGGVEIGKNGEVVAYYIAQKHPLSADIGQNEWVRVEAFGRVTGRPNILHLMEAERPEQRRGVPILAPVIESLKQLSRYTEAELMAAVVSGMYTVFIETKSPTTEIPLGESVPEEYQVDIEDENTYELGNGAIIALGEGETIKEANPGRPNSAFDGFVVAVCRQIGAALEIPYELLVKQFTASYSASRAALLEAWKMFRMRRSWLASDFCQPIYEEWLAEAVAKGRVPAPGFFSDPIIRKAYSEAEWNGPSQGQIDPLKEVKAAAQRVSEGFSTRAKETVELTGGDFYKNHRQRVREEKLRREGGLVKDEQNSKTDV
ncbi:phage portal protein [Tepidanaerobacter syntrophicus]|uniref:Phage portal protein, lambda family n=1 Tax=Tepidanaerobacter syntrophicus TaxID=224999 RepID=A0A0U9HEE2_9FIRM|nr:phage portal protein [Tepidanaerobacter syntrophicus]GAQ24228.1 phage portal protein, lambda family [Tepidanaerobacter syntrophicus]